MRQEDELKQIASVSDRLAVRHPDLDRRTIEAAVQEAHGVYAGSRVRDFVPLLVERDARDLLAGRGRTPSGLALAARARPR
ncbi:three-helix bundle dimerization domain-containing protein [Cellulomonas sp. KRMCY2]|uniref:three-helix bundle dimerization domain-containing protein n=1 Tax=Cellulomonas sp. KRMCY2 TaxID=1304865 RepID=UPI00045EB4F4|nr:hypothetical protein [Cellulomonas sp. KRMCY2]